MSNNNDIICLNRDTVLINGVRFIGAVGWHNFVAGEPYPTKMQINAWANHSNEPYIRWDNKGTTCNPNLVLNESQLDFEYIRDTVARYPNDKIVVMTHHLPHRSLSWFKPHDPIWTQLHGMFVNTMMELITDSNIKYWVFGHTHSRMMREINGILYVANPRGYPNETENWEPIDLDV
jgi:DNA repair exonuclease SbcCD nuclease subunit